MLQHNSSVSLWNARMKTIGTVRRQRLKMLIDERGMTYAQVNAKLGRTRIDSTLSQIANAAPDSKSGKPREMGDAQARLLEAAFDLETGWFDRDPDFDQTIDRLKALQAAEPAQIYDVWPFPNVERSAIMRLPKEVKGQIEGMICSALQIWDTNSHQDAAGESTTSNAAPSQGDKYFQSGK